MLALSYALPFDVYLIDEMLAVGDQPFRQKCLAMLAERSRQSGVILASRAVNVARRYGDTAGIIHGRQILLYDNLEQAIADFQQLGLEEEKSIPDLPVEESP